MQVNWKSFKKDSNFFLKYFFWQMVTSVGMLLVVVTMKDSLTFLPNLSLSYLMLLPVAVFLGIQLPVVLHNAVHFNFRSKFFNEVVGELAGFFVLFGLGPFRISHFLHHAFSDTEWDTHPPEGKGFWQFLATTQLSTITVIRKKFLQIHGDNRKNHVVLFVEMGCYYVSLLARVMVWFFLLGPEFFVALYIPAYITNVMVFAHINYATHVTNEEGVSEVVNLNHNLYYKFINKIGSGVYFHKNHHKQPYLYNPMKDVNRKKLAHG